MHFYVYDEALTQPKLAAALANVEARLTDLELHGRVGRLGPLKSAKDMVRQAVRAGATTIVAVGTDKVIGETLDAIAGTDTTLGIIPIGEPTTIAHHLGIPVGERAVEVLAARKVEIIDLGKIDTHYFLTEIEVAAAKPLTLECDERYTVSIPKTTNRVILANLTTAAYCQDGYLEAHFAPPTKRSWLRTTVPHTSTVPFKHVRIFAGEEETATVHGNYTIKLPAIAEVMPRSLRVIVGRDRSF